MGLLKTALQLSFASGRSLSGRCSSVSAVFILTNHKEKQVGARQAPLSFRVCHPSDDPSVVFASQEISTKPVSLNKGRVKEIEGDRNTQSNRT